MKFNDAVEIILKHEAGYVWNPRDPGGETNFGISKRAYPLLDIKNLTRDEAIEIYRRDYWDRCKIDLLPQALRLIVFDSAVNQGPQVSIALLQAALGVKADGDLGPDSLKAINGANLEKLIQAYARFRLNRYFDNRNFQTFGEGWVRRLQEISLICAHQAGEQKGLA